MSVKGGSTVYLLFVSIDNISIMQRWGSGKTLKGLEARVTWLTSGRCKLGRGKGPNISLPCLSWKQMFGRDVQDCHQRFALISLSSLIPTLTLTPPPNNALLANLEINITLCLAWPATNQKWPQKGSTGTTARGSLDPRAVNNHWNGPQWNGLLEWTTTFLH